MRVRKIAVLGAGTMGAQIAAHFANASIPSLLFDMPGLAQQALSRLNKLEPAPLFDPSLLALIEPLDFETGFQRLKEADWVIEAVIEDLNAKRQLLRAIQPFLRPDAIITSNTSGLPLQTIAAEMPDDFQKRSFGTHFFNPPRYLKLLEIIPTPNSEPALVSYIAEFADRFLGKGVIYAKDTPNFIANRLATFGGLYTLKLMVEQGYSIEEVDALTGPLVGRPKTATFRLFDLVGLDVFALVARNLYQNLPDDEHRDIFHVPDLIRQMLDHKWLGAKTGQGFYKKSGKDLLAIDFRTMEYKPVKKPAFPVVDMLRPIENSAERAARLMESPDRAGAFVWKTTSAFLAYAANRIPEISDDIVQVDRAMRWGFGWSHGPFELWDAMGFKPVVDRMRKEGLQLPAWLDRLFGQENPSFYRIRNGKQECWNVLSESYTGIPERAGVTVLADIKRARGEVKRNAGASLIDLGDGVLCLEFHAKVNAIGADTIHMARTAVELLEKDYAGLLIGNQGENFSAGANLMLVLLEAQEGNWEELNVAIKAFQQMAMSFRYSPKPVIAAPFGLTLGGGCEICLSCDAIHSASEVYTGLPEVGVGLLPAGSGTKEMLRRAFSSMPDGADPLPYMRKAFETIAMGKVSRSVLEARKLGYFRQSDTFSMNQDRLIADAKTIVLQMSHNYRQPQPSKDILMTGRAGFAYLQTGIYLMRQGGYISDYDAKLGEKIAWVMTGGDLTQPAHVDEQFVLDLEREAFLSLLGERKTQERIQHILKTGKPLRN